MQVSNLPFAKVVELEEVEAIRVTITLGRKLLGVLLNVFVPTAILNLISFSTNFYKVILSKDKVIILNIFSPAFGNTNITMVMELKLIQRLLAPLYDQ